tara:strand:- start:3220 stop:3888 length:669 start_codon:yes stop_codon:yes gene_type:complete
MTIRTEDQVKEGFLKNIANHTMTVLQDNGVYRHLEFSHNGSSNQKFSLVTYPQHLVFSGDMGTYVFSRLNDMFEFFRNEKLVINAYYWSHKVESISKNGGVMVFDEGLVTKSIATRVDDICADLDGYFEDNQDEDIETVEAFEAAFRAEIKSHFEYGEMDEYRHVSTIDDFDSTVIANLDFTDCWEWMDNETFSGRYLWCCCAVVWGIQEYDKLALLSKEVA